VLIYRLAAGSVSSVFHLHGSVVCNSTPQHRISASKYMVGVHVNYTHGISKTPPTHPPRKISSQGKIPAPIRWIGRRSRQIQTPALLAQPLCLPRRDPIERARYSRRRFQLKMNMSRKFRERGTFGHGLLLPPLQRYLLRCFWECRICLVDCW
jgi:hypothetical protein